MTLTVFVVIWACLSVLTALVTEAVKKFTTTDFPENLIALIIAIVTGVCVTGFYYAQNGIPFTLLNVAYMAAIAVLNWVGSMVGYDKVKQAILQLTDDDDEDEVERDDDDRSDSAEDTAESTEDAKEE